MTDWTNTSNLNANDIVFVISLISRAAAGLLVGEAEKSFHAEGAAVVQWPDHSPPTHDRFLRGVRSRILACGNHVGRCRWTACYLGDLPLPPPALAFRPLLRTHLASPTSALKTSRSRDALMSPLKVALLVTTLLHARGPECNECVGQAGMEGIPFATNSAELRLVLQGGAVKRALLPTGGDRESCFTLIERMSAIPMRMIDVSMEQHRNERPGETGDPRENPSTSGIVRHDSHMRKPRRKSNLVRLVNSFRVRFTNATDNMLQVSRDCQLIYADIKVFDGYSVVQALATVQSILFSGEPPNPATPIVKYRPKLAYSCVTYTIVCTGSEWGKRGACIVVIEGLSGALAQKEEAYRDGRAQQNRLRPEGALGKSVRESQRRYIHIYNLFRAGEIRLVQLVPFLPPGARVTGVSSQWSGAFLRPASSGAACFNYGITHTHTHTHTDRSFIMRTASPQASGQLLSLHIPACDDIDSSNLPLKPPCGSLTATSLPPRHGAITFTLACRTHRPKVPFTCNISTIVDAVIERVKWFLKSRECHVGSFFEIPTRWSTSDIGLTSRDNRVGRCRWSAGLHGDLPSPPPPNSGAAPILTSIVLIGSEDLAVKGHPNIFKNFVFNDLQARLYSLMYKYARINCTLPLVVYCHSGRRQLDTVLQEVSNTVWTNGLSYINAAVCSLAVAPHLAVMGFARLFPCMSAIGSESFRADLYMRLTSILSRNEFAKFSYLNLLQRTRHFTIDFKTLAFPCYFRDWFTRRLNRPARLRTSNARAETEGANHIQPGTQDQVRVIKAQGQRTHDSAWRVYTEPLT
ncbi:hypothetical protein PR048_030874 [Dryococelus australis]|uniref:Uncharacterized protein n=1 Tax=Dryococelus australis TaxID=614101 RepID=A0ABQ9GA47_9NEOP|nr:hypothetical protein PR048_030874 [Dryococelus australis]